MPKKRKARRRPKKRETRNVINYIIIVLFAVLIGLVYLFLHGLDKRMLPSALQAVDMLAKSRVNAAINESVSNIIEKYGLTSSDFYETTENESGKLNTLSVNTVLINQICNEAAVDVSQSLNQAKSEKIQLPYGALLGIDAFSNIGPKFTITVLPMGDAVVDYSSSFESVGINQVNFQIWLTVDARMQVINPLQSTEVTIQRKIALVNTIINSEVPQTYFNSSDNLKKIIE